MIQEKQSSTRLGKRKRDLIEDQENKENSCVDDLESNQVLKQPKTSSQTVMMSKAGNLTNVKDLNTASQQIMSANTQQKVTNGIQPQHEIVAEMLDTLVEQFNCNHQADLDDGDSLKGKSGTQQIIYNRDAELKQINDFLINNLSKSRSGLMYLCGHPGTGKTSSLNFVLSNIRRNMKQSASKRQELFMYNAMTYIDVKSFAILLLEDLTKRLTDWKPKNVQRNTYDDEDLANEIAKVLSRSDKSVHKMIVIDEIDCFSSHEKSFTLLVKAILKANTNNKSNQTNTSLIGIANSVDLPFRKKHSAIAMRDCQLLFKPYSTDDLIDIMQCKINKKYSDLPDKMKVDTIKKIFFTIVDEKAYEFVAKKVSKLNGDVRVAFDLMKSALSTLSQNLKKQGCMPQDGKVQVQFPLMLRIFEQKYGSKVPETLASLPRQDIVVLDAITRLFEDLGEEKKVSFQVLFKTVEYMCKEKFIDRIEYNQFVNAMEELDHYNLIMIEKNQKNAKMNLFVLKAELYEIIQGLDRLRQKRIEEAYAKNKLIQAQALDKETDPEKDMKTPIQEEKMTTSDELQ